MTATHVRKRIGDLLGPVAVAYKADLTDFVLARSLNAMEIGA